MKAVPLPVQVALIMTENWRRVNVNLLELGTAYTSEHFARYD